MCGGLPLWRSILKQILLHFTDGKTETRRDRVVQCFTACDWQWDNSHLSFSDIPALQDSWDSWPGCRLMTVFSPQRDFSMTRKFENTGRPREGTAKTLKRAEEMWEKVDKGALEANTTDFLILVLPQGSFKRMNKERKKKSINGSQCLNLQDRKVSGWTSLKIR